MKKQDSIISRLLNKYKSMNKVQISVHVLTVFISLISLVVVILSLVKVNDIHSFYLENAEKWINFGEPAIINGVDYSSILQAYPDKGPEAISWFLTAGDNVGGIYYILTIVFGTIALPSFVYTLSFFLLCLFPRKTKEEKQEIKLKKSNKGKAK